MLAPDRGTLRRSEEPLNRLRLGDTRCEVDYLVSRCQVVIVQMAGHHVEVEVEDVLARRLLVLPDRAPSRPERPLHRFGGLLSQAMIAP